MQCPDEITDEVLSFSRTISQATPVYIESTPLKGKPSRECFPIVAAHVKEFGGSREIGWSIYIWPKVFIEAELHAVWVDLEGVRRDIAPHQWPAKRIMFLPDQSASYGETHVVKNRRHALNPDSLVKKFIDTSDAIYEEENRGELAKQAHFDVTPQWLALQRTKAECQEQLMQKYGIPPGLPVLVPPVSAKLNLTMKPYFQ